jgi:hypothetical protein
MDATAPREVILLSIATGDEKMNAQTKSSVPCKEHPVDVKIGNVADCRKRMSGAIAKRAYEIYQRDERHPGRDLENWLLAESEVVQPLCCGVLNSKDEVFVSLFCSALGAKDVEEIEAFVEPHRLILVAKKRPSPESAGDPYIYRVFPLTGEFDPSSVKLRQHGSLLEIKIHKSSVSKDSIAMKKAA